MELGVSVRWQLFDPPDSIGTIMGRILLIIIFFLGFLAGSAVAVKKRGAVYHYAERIEEIYGEKWEEWKYRLTRPWTRKTIVEDFSQAVPAVSGKSFGRDGQLTLELFREGTFIIDGSGVAHQKSPNYGDSAIIRSTDPLPPTYKITAVVGHIDYGLDNLAGLTPDPEYPEGPLNENGCYLLTITDEPPIGNHTNIWWHQHRKLVVDVDNNVWGHGAPNPIFMVYFNTDNQLRSFDGQTSSWGKAWNKAVQYEEKAWYTVTIEKTFEKYKMSISDEKGRVLKQSEVPIKEVWHGEGDHPDYFALGDPHENYYQGSMKIREIRVEY